MSIDIINLIYCTLLVGIASCVPKQLRLVMSIAVLHKCAPNEECKLISMLLFRKSINGFLIYVLSFITISIHLYIRNT